MPAPVPDQIGPPRTASGSAYRFALAEAPDRWLVMIAPGCDLEAARHALEWRWGQERVLDVRPLGARSAAKQKRTASPGPSGRHRWEKTGPHRYLCRHCKTIKRNWIDPDTQQWFQTYQPPDGRPERHKRVPACRGGI